MIFLDEKILSAQPYSLNAEEKKKLFSEKLRELTRHHTAHCEPYRKIVDMLGFDETHSHPIADYPFLPARIFKAHELKSIAATDVKKTLTSSGTSGQTPSRIFLDAETAGLQTKILSRIISDYLGTQRLPMLIIDAPSTVKRGGQFSARATGIVGYSLFGRDPTYALNDDMSLNVEALKKFQNKHAGQKIFVFGFTFMIFQYFLKALEDTKQVCDLSNAFMIHGGGWKKLADIAIDDTAFRKRLHNVSGIKNVHNYYGIVEQTGSVCMGCEHGHLHVSNFSDIIIRDVQFNDVGIGTKGLVQMLSLVPHSYPGHSLLTEDEGTILGEDDCPCGRKGKYFQIHGRAAQAEMRGCSDTYVAK